MENKVKVVKGFEFKRDVATKFGVLPMIATVTFTEATEIAKVEFSCNTHMEVRTYISGLWNTEKKEAYFVNVDMNDEETLHTFANDYVTKTQKENVESVAVDMYIRNDSDFWAMFEDEDLSEPDMSEYAEDKNKYFKEILWDMEWSRF